MGVNRKQSAYIETKRSCIRIKVEGKIEPQCQSLPIGNPIDTEVFKDRGLI